MYQYASQIEYDLFHIRMSETLAYILPPSVPIYTVEIYKQFSMLSIFEKSFENTLAV